MDSNSYYAAVIIYETSSPSTTYKPLYEEEVALIEASSEEEAKERAISHANEQETSYENQYGETITNSFKLLADIQLIQSKPEHGTSIYTRFFRNYDAYAAFEPLLEGEEL